MADDSTSETPVSPASAKVVAPAATAEKDEAPPVPKLTNKELKELKKKEKAAKRAAQKTANGITPEQQEKIAEQKMEKKKQQLATNTNLKKQLNQSVIKNDTKRKVPTLFSHLETREQRNAASPSISHIVHPSILLLTLKYSTYKIVGSSARLRNLMEVFKVVIKDYVTPLNTTLTRHLTGHLSHQIEYLKSARPLSTSMGNAIRWLKQEISHISIDTTEEQAKEFLVERIDEFIREKLDLSDRLIVENASKHITQDANILTYGHSQVLEELFKYCATEQNKSFTLTIVDSRPLFEGKKLLSNLVDTVVDSSDSESDVDSISRRLAKGKPITQDKIKINYVLINALSSTILEDVDCVFLGAHAMLSNGHLYSRVGTGLIAMMCNTRNIPVLTCCESIKFSDKVQLDSVTTNELADPEDLVHDLDSKSPPQKKAFSLEQFIKKCDDEKKAEEAKPQPGKKGQQQKNTKEPEATEVEDKSPLKNWKNIDNINVLNIMYDLTPPQYIKKVVTEFGALPPSSVPVILREYKNSGN